MRYILLSLILAIAITGCSTSDTITQPTDVRAAADANAHMLCGLYRFEVFPSEERIEIVPLREAALHLNAIPFLEPAPPFQMFVGLDGGIQVTANSVACRIFLEHPLGINQFAGFDVCGILISHGSASPYYDTSLVIPGDNDVRLVNADGYSRWWNPVEFPHEQGSTAAYNDGFLGTPDSAANYTATLNGYKFFADGLGAYDPVTSLGAESRCYFSPGEKNIRYYNIAFTGGNFVFNYAVDASWSSPTGLPPYDIPDDFPPLANRPEAWHASLDIQDNTLYNDGSENGGDLDIRVTVYDHYLAEENTVRVESPGNLIIKASSTPAETGTGYARYDFSYTDATPAEDSIDLFITVENSDIGYAGIIPGKAVSTYFFEEVPVSQYGPGVDADLVLDVVRNDYAPPGPGYPQSWISQVDLDWNDLPGAAQYAVYRSPLWADPYQWALIGTTDAVTTVFSNTNSDDNPIDWDEDYIYEVRPRSIVDNPGSEGPPTERAYVILESNNDDHGNDPLNPKWVNKSGSGGDFDFSYANLSSCDESSKIGGSLDFSTIDNDSWEIVYCPSPLPDIPGQSKCIIDFAFSTFNSVAIPFQAGFAPGSMSVPPEGGETDYPDFQTAPFTNNEEGQPYNNPSCTGFETHFGGTTYWAYSGQCQIYRGARFRIPKLLQSDVDYIGIGIASTGIVTIYVFDLAIDSIAVAVY